MASYLVQAGTNLYTMSRSGVATQIVLPPGITLYGGSIPCRATVLGSAATPNIIVVNGGTQDFYIDATGFARQLQVSAPTAGPVLSAGTGTGLTGIYGVAISFKVKDANLGLISESALGPTTFSASLSNNSLKMQNIPVSGDTGINSRGIYRTTSGGNILYPWFDIDDNITLTEDRDTVDALLSILPTTANMNGAPPDLKLITVWNDALWGVPREKIDSVRWTENRLFYGWAQSNEAIIQPKQTDNLGVTAFIPRRDQLGVTRYNRTYQITGKDDDTYAVNGISNDIGCMSQESVVIVRDVAYWLGERGIVQWDTQGIGYVSEAQVTPWFITDTYFNRALFTQAKARYNPDTDAYELLLASAGSSVLNQWVCYDIKMKRWFGPHITNGFIPTATGTNGAFAGTLTDKNLTPIVVFGSSSGTLFRRDVTTANDNGFAVPYVLSLPIAAGGTPGSPVASPMTFPDMQTYWGELSVHSRPEVAGSVTVTPTVGEINASPSAPFTHNLTIPRERLPRLGVGKYMQLTFTHNNLNEPFRLHGIIINWNLVGRR